MTFDMKDFLTENKCTYATGLNEGKVNYSALAKRVITTAEAMLKSSKSHYQGQPDMIKMFEDDHRDLLFVAKLIKKGDLRGAAQKAWQMDTAARDEIPTDVYDVLMDA